MTTSTSPAPFTTDYSRWLIASWHTDRRYYHAEIMQDLFGTWLLKRTWGGLGNKRGNSKSYPFADYQEAIKHFEVIAQKRQQRGYVREAYHIDSVRYVLSDARFPGDLCQT